MRQLVKESDSYTVMEDGRPIARLEKNSFGTHGHSRGYLTYIRNRNGVWMWSGADPRITKEKHEEPPFFANLKEIKMYFGIA